MVVEPAVPLRNAVEQRHNGEHCTGERKNNAEEGRDIVAAVQGCGLDQLIRDGVFKEGAHDDHVIGTDGGRQHQRPDLIQHTQLLNDQISGDHAAVEKHGKDEKADKDIAPEQILAGQGVGGAGGKGHADQGAQHGIQDRVQITRPDAGILQNLLIHGGRKAFGPEGNIACQQLHGITERAADDVQKRQNDGCADQDQQQIHNNGIDPFPDAFLHFRGVIHRINILFHHHRLTSLIFLLNLLNSTIMVKLITELNRPTAAEKL